MLPLIVPDQSSGHFTCWLWNKMVCFSPTLWLFPPQYSFELISFYKATLSMFKYVWYLLFAVALNRFKGKLNLGFISVAPATGSISYDSTVCKVTAEICGKTHDQFLPVCLNCNIMTKNYKNKLFSFEISDIICFHLRSN